MRLIDTYAQLKTLNQPVFQTRSIAAFLNLNIATASKILTRLTKSGHLVKLRSGLWCLPEQIEPTLLPQYLTAPFPSYISLQSALYYHGMISQIPAIIYAVSLARTKKYSTALGTVSIHHVQPDFFFSFESIGLRGIKMASPEKALLDICYLSSAKTKLFHSLPELELSANFDFNKAHQIVDSIKTPPKKTMVARRLREFLKTT